MVHAQADSSPQNAAAYYDSGDFETAAKLYEDLATSDMSGWYSYLAGKARYFSEQLDAAESTFERIVRDEAVIPRRTVAASRYFLGRIAFDRDRFSDAAGEFVLSFALTPDADLREVSYINILNLCSGYLSHTQLRELLASVHKRDQALFSDIVYNTARTYYEHGLYRKAERVIDLHDALAGSGDAQIGKLAADIAGSLSNSLELALLVPLSGDLALYGRQMSRAAELAIESYDHPDIRVDIQSYDTYGNSIVASQLSRSVTSSGVSAVIGPLTSDEAVGAAPYSDFWSVPMVLPAASEKGLTSISTRVIQLTPTPETMGIRLGEAAIAELGLDSVAILAPNDAYGRQITDGFKRIMMRDSVTIFSETFFARGATDFRRFMIGLKEMVLPDFFDPAIYLDASGDTLETEEIPVRIPALFIPAYSAELRFIIPQLRFYRIETIVLGSEDLGLEEIVNLRDTRYYPTLFVSRSAHMPDDTSWLKFDFLFRDEGDEVPSHVAGMTFDAVSLTLKAAELGGYTADGIAQGWRQLGIYEGVTGPYKFNERNENVAAPVYIIYGGQIERWSP